MLFRVIILCNLFCVFGQKFFKYRLMWIEPGLVKGKIYEMGQTKAQIYLGIPYAEPPTGELKFRRPVKKLRWRGVITMFEYRSHCIQFADFDKTDGFGGESMGNYQSEDCLYLNVFAPYIDIDTHNIYPVIVWIHGGSFLSGSGDIPIDHGVIENICKGAVLVTLSYRLGPLGMESYQKILLHRKSGFLFYASWHIKWTANGKEIMVFGIR